MPLARPVHLHRPDVDVGGGEGAEDEGRDRVIAHDGVQDRPAAQVLQVQGLAGGRATQRLVVGESELHVGHRLREGIEEDQVVPERRSQDGDRVCAGQPLVTDAA